jgi:predicted dehydrogenase
MMKPPGHNSDGLNGGMNGNGLNGNGHHAEELSETPVRLGIIGIGTIGRQQFTCAMASPALDVIAIADPKLVNQQRAFEPVSVYENWRELIALSEVDAVSICVPHTQHLEMTMAALEAGKHVLVEKPLVLSTDECRILIAAAKKYDRTLMVEMTHRFYPAFKGARAQVLAGRLGEIYAVEDRIVEPAAQQIHQWLRTKETAGGGVAFTNGIHMLDRIAAITGQALQFTSGLAGYSAKLGDVEDTASMMLSLENGAPVQLLAAWPRGSGNCDDELTIYGTKGTLRLWAWRGWQLEPLNSNEAPQEKMYYLPYDDAAAHVRAGLTGALEEFAAAITESREPVPPASAALVAQELIEQFYHHVSLYQSVESGE